MSDKTTPITGGCLCGAVRYEASGLPTDSAYCHCKMCQRWKGAPVSASAGFRTATLRITRGQPKFYQSSPHVHRGFCSDCGSSLFIRYPESDEIWVGTGTMDEAENVQPRRHMGIESQLPWFMIADDLPRIRSDEEPGTPDYESAAKSRGG